jgi:hypothetical protein
MSANWEFIALGCAGGLIPDLIRIAKSRYDTTIADYLKRWNFWVGLAVLVGLGGLAALIGGAANVTDALVYGYAAPELFSRVAAEHGAPPSPGTEGHAEGLEVNPKSEKFNVRRWWSV